MTSSRYREFAEKHTSRELSLQQHEVRAYVLSECPKPVRLELKDKVDWANVDLIGRRCVKKLQRKYDISAKDAKEIIRDTYLGALSAAEVEEE